MEIEIKNQIKLSKKLEGKYNFLGNGLLFSISGKFLEIGKVQDENFPVYNFKFKILFVRYYKNIVYVVCFSESEKKSHIFDFRDGEKNEIIVVDGIVHDMCFLKNQIALSTNGNIFVFKNLILEKEFVEIFFENEDIIKNIYFETENNLFLHTFEGALYELEISEGMIYRNTESTYFNYIYQDLDGNIISFSWDIIFKNNLNYCDKIKNSNFCKISKNGEVIANSCDKKIMFVFLQDEEYVISCQEIKSGMIFEEDIDISTCGNWFLITENNSTSVFELGF